MKLLRFSVLSLLFHHSLPVHPVPPPFAIDIQAVFFLHVASLAISSVLCFVINPDPEVLFTAESWRDVSPSSPYHVLFSLAIAKVNSHFRPAKGKKEL